MKLDLEDMLFIPEYEKETCRPSPCCFNLSILAFLYGKL